MTILLNVCELKKTVINFLRKKCKNIKIESAPGCIGYKHVQQLPEGITYNYQVEELDTC